MKCLQTLSIERDTIRTCDWYLFRCYLGHLCSVNFSPSSTLVLFPPNFFFIPSNSSSFSPFHDDRIPFKMIFMVHIALTHSSRLHRKHHTFSHKIFHLSLRHKLMLSIFVFFLPSISFSSEFHSSHCIDAPLILFTSVIFYTKTKPSNVALYALLHQFPRSVHTDHSPCDDNDDTQANSI